MAKVNGYYQETIFETRGGTALYGKEGRKLCFVCAVRAATADAKLSQIHFETTDFEYTKCAVCEEYLRDSVEI